MVRKRLVLDSNDKTIITPEFVSRTIHQLKTPLTGVYGYLQLLRTNAQSDTKLAEKYKKWIEAAFIESKRIDKLLGDLTRVYQLENRRDSLIFEPLNLVQIVQEISVLYKDKSSVIFTTRLKSASIIGNKNLLKNCISEIIENGLKHTKKKSRVTVSLTSMRHGFSLKIEDHGIGMADETIKKLLSSHHPKASGIGVVFYNARLLINLHKGEFDVVSKVGIGTIISFYFPKA